MKFLSSVCRIRRFILFSSNIYIRNNFMKISLLVLFFALLLALFRIYQLQKPRVLVCPDPPTCPPMKSIIRPVVKFFGMKQGDQHLNVILSVFQKVGYEVEKGDSNHWDVLWSHTYPFQILGKEMAHLKPYQKVNHFPGSGYITQKANLATGASKHVPRAFIMPEDKEKLLQYSKENPDAMFVQKSNSHRGIKVNTDMKRFDMDAKGTFIQEFIKNPFLIDERKFDLGVYAILTSIDPLRVYVYNSDILLRFCTEKYHKFSPEFLESYVVSDDYLPVWEVPALQPCFSKFNYTAKECFNSYLRMQGLNPWKLWSQVHEAIRDVYFKSEDAIIKATLQFGNLRNYFELVRFDFVLDEEQNVFLLEANMSPNLSSEHFAPNRLLYEQVLFNVLSINGLTSFLRRSNVREDFEVSNKDIQVFPEDCNSEVCNKSCKLLKCHVCNQCMTEELRQVAKTAYLEQMNKRNFYRLIPAAVYNLNGINVPQEISHDKSVMNYVMDRWFKGKCLQDVEWCY